MIESSDEKGEEFGMDRLLGCFAENAGKPLTESLEATYQAVRGHSPDEAQQDDISLVAFEVT
jgi:serine phosphatase RsbU (regulator of sigma subunit)